MSETATTKNVKKTPPIPPPAVTFGKAPRAGMVAANGQPTVAPEQNPTSTRPELPCEVG